MFRRKLPTLWLTHNMFICLLLLSLAISFVNWRAQAGRRLSGTKANGLTAVMAKTFARSATLSGGKKYGGQTVLHISTEQELRDALTATNGAQNGDIVVFDADITLSRDLPAEPLRRSSWMIFAAGSRIVARPSYSIKNRCIENRPHTFGQMPAFAHGRNLDDYQNK